jgi:hypothetical protein
MAWTFDRLIDRLQHPQTGNWIARLGFVQNGSSQTVELKFKQFPSNQTLQDERPRLLAILNAPPVKEKIPTMRARIEQLKDFIRSRSLSIPDGDDE